MDQLATGFVYYVVFLFSTTAHEAAHAWAAKIGGDLTAYHGGQVSLDPRPHIKREPFGMVILPLLGILTSGWPFGFASAPYDLTWAMRHPRRAGWMAVAGPAANLTIVLVSGILVHVGIAIGAFHSPDSANFDRIVSASWGGSWPALAFVLSVLFSLNLMLAFLNLIPLPPLDGSAAVILGLPEETARRYQLMLMQSHAFGMVGLLVAWRVFDLLYDPIFITALNLLYPGAAYG